ncbi:Predicted esterase [Noviherbaspirillum humi]|uniref:Predicted esterase n=1 Tax=Noviherbaspirillum humi TaxID=1688639 RepID=A0A239HPN6_9BURK|nr:alpha/beta hydrolase-fold protein [Noviherbaspirillum humi]SNS83105.1 Predicted esterase [Noviherbaspirillum humi]
MKKRQNRHSKPMLIASAAMAVLAGCGGSPQDGASAGASRQLADGTFSLLSPLAPASDLGGADTPQPDYSSQSLYSGPGPRPGPDLLYAAPPRAPQLENAGIWKARPILVSGASAYRRGEFLYQDFLYDDRGAKALPDPADPRVKAETFSGGSGTYTYPSDPAFANNAADIVELRIKPQSTHTAFRLTMNSLLDPARLAFTIAIGDSAAPRPFPFGANVSAPARFFLTVHGSEAVLTDAATGAAITPAPAVSIDLERRQIQVNVPTAAWNPGKGVVRIAAGAGLWDAANNRYLLPTPTASASQPGGAGQLLAPPAFFNVAFRFNEPDAYWREQAQSQALASGDISAFYANVDFGKLAANVNDDMPGQPQGVPQSGPINRIFASHVETKQGVDFSVDCGSAPTCKGEYRGQLQPYTLYLPTKPKPAGGYGLTLLLHSLGGNHNQYFASKNQSQLGERGQGHLVATALGRGPDGWYVEDAAADTFEMWADIARNYPLNADMTSISGYSMGGHATYKFGTRYPDLFAKAHAVVGPPALGIWAPPAEPTGGDATNTYHLLPGLRNIPIMMWVQATDELVPYVGTKAQAQRLDDLGYRYRFDTFTTGDHLALALNDEFQGSADFLGDAIVNRNPAHVTYVANPAMDVPSRGLVGNHAYWLSKIAVRDTGAGAPRGSIDAISRAFGEGDPVASPTGSGAGVITGKLGAQAYVSQYKTWSLPTATAAADRLDIVARNVSSVTVNVQRAKLSCNAALVVDTDGPLTVELEGCGRQVRY